MPLPLKGKVRAERGPRCVFPRCTSCPTGGRRSSWPMRGPDAPWSRCGVEDYLRRMDRYHIEKALLLPVNDPYLYCQDPDETNRFLGGMKWQDAVSGCTWADISYILPRLAALYGIGQTNRILRAFGPDRLIFGTDFPDGAYDDYFQILDQMDFTDGEIEKIAWRNIESLLA